MRFKIRAESIVVFLLVISAILWLLQSVVMNRRNIVTSDGSFPITVYDDREVGGNSFGSYIENGYGWVFEYELKEGVMYPFCVFSIDISKNKKGLNLTAFDEMVIWTRYEGVGNGNIRVELRNQHPEYSKEGDKVSLKYNEVQYSPSEVTYPLHLTWQNFQVPNWWIAERNIPLHQHKVDVSNTMLVEFHSGEKVPMGKGKITIDKVEFRGKWLNQTVFANILLGFWIGTWSMYLIISLFNMRKELIEREKQKQELMAINNALAIEKERAEQKAKRDELTGLLNRYGMYELVLELFKAKRDEIVSIIFVDIDHFKIINDTKGHTEGDRILKEIAKCLSNLLRKEDIVARWGGEEFLIVCSTNNEDGLFALAEKLRLGIQALPDNVTCSFGGARGRHQKFQEIIEKADKALYEAKDSGRNCVVLHLPNGDYRKKPLGLALKV